MKRKSQAGFTLIEVLVTILLIGATLAIYRVTAQTVVVNKWNKNKEVALRIAEKKMESLRTTSFASLPSTGSFADAALSDLPSGAGNLTVTNVNDETKNIQVTVTWTNPGDPTSQSISIETSITEGGIGQ
jgi:prepilin-type N-terminal cleavage/methylation domain-containing protein